jgi:allantoinase
MAPLTAALRSSNILTPTGPQAGTVLIAGTRIEAVVGEGDQPDGVPLIDLGDAMIAPGLIDPHVHLNDPGREAWEGFETGTRAAAAGGITCLVDMPLNSSPVTTTLAALQAKQQAASGRVYVDVGFWGGVVPGNRAELAPMVEAGALGFKAFTCHSGIDEFPASDEAVLRGAMEELAPLGVPLLVHAELEAHAPPPVAGADARKYATYLASRPPAMEVAAVELVVRLCRETGCRVHIVHLSAADALPAIARARAEGLPLTAETCPHYLTFAAEEIPDGATAFKCAPPIREAANRERLWAGLLDGTLSFVACDHSPCTPGLKLPDTGDFLGAWGGIASLQFSLPAVWTEARRRRVPVAQALAWLTARPAAFVGLNGRKGSIAPGMEADLVAWRPEATLTVEADRILHRHPTTPYLARALRGVVEATWLRGELIHRAGQVAPSPRGQLLGGPSQGPSPTRSFP